MYISWTIKCLILLMHGATMKFSDEGLFCVNLNVTVTGMQQHLLYDGQPEPDPLPVPIFTQVFLGHLQLRLIQQQETVQRH